MERGESGRKRKELTWFVENINVKYDYFFIIMSHVQLRRRQRSTQTLSKQNTSAPLSRAALLEASPQEHGLVQKLHVPLFYSIFPYFIQKCLASIPVLKQLVSPRWETRYLVLLGSYLYKFDDEGYKKVAPSQPKGSPLALSSIDVYIVDKDDLRNLSFEGQREFLEAGTVFCVSTFRKQYYYSVSDHEQATVWVNSILDARQEAIKRSMGHADKDSYPKAWVYFDHLGRNLKNQKERIRIRVERKDIQELEMSQLKEGAPFSSGYFG